MIAIRIQKRIDSETLHLPELRPLIGKTVEIEVREGALSGAQADPYAALFALAGQDVVDPDAYLKLRAASLI
jgi:hypothetical protein